MKIHVFHDYGGEITHELFYRAGEHEVDENTAMRMIEHGLAEPVMPEVEPEIIIEVEPAASPKRKPRGAK